MTDDEIEELWLYARGKWPSFTVSDHPAIQAMTLLAWRDDLGDLDQATVRAAMVALGERDFLPPLGLLRRAALDLLDPNPAPPLDVAWSEVMTAVSRYGRARQPEWTHPAVAAAVRSLGWSSVCDSRVDTIGVVRGQFARLYGTAEERLRRESRPVAPALAAYAARAVHRVDETLALGPGIP